MICYPRHLCYPDDNRGKTGAVAHQQNAQRASTHLCLARMSIIALHVIRGCTHNLSVGIVSFLLLNEGIIRMTTFGCHVMAKPTGSVCNIDCSYCFYLEKEVLYPERKQNWRMNDNTLEQYICQHIAAQPGEEVLFTWQRGEPTLMVLDFFHKVISLCQKYG